MKAQPEEKVRQDLIRYMVEVLKYPKSMITVEKALSKMPHIEVSTKKLPLRRSDIVCFAKGIHPKYSLYPLLLIECKAVKLTSEAITQVTGYNHYVRSYFVAVANEEEVRTGYYDPLQKKYIFVNGLPSYQELLNNLKK